MSECISAFRKANKAHRCDFCGCAIEKGNTYRHSALFGEGTAWTWKAHEVCNRLWQGEISDHCDEEWSEDYQLWRELAEQYAEPQDVLPWATEPVTRDAEGA